MKGEFNVGSVVRSVAGHDSDAYYIVVKVIDGDYVMIADGRARLLAKPKLKKVKHLRLTGIVLSDIAYKIESGAVLHDKTVYKAISDAIIK